MLKTKTQQQPKPKRITKKEKQREELKTLSVKLGDSTGDIVQSFVGTLPGSIWTAGFLTYLILQYGNPAMQKYFGTMPVMRGGGIMGGIHDAIYASGAGARERLGVAQSELDTFYETFFGILAPYRPL